MLARSVGEKLGAAGHRQLLAGQRRRGGALRRDNEIELRFDLPGIDTDSIDVTLDRGVLTVSARRSEEYAENEKPFVRERVMGSFTRRLRLSDTVDAEQIAASYVVTVKVPLARACTAAQDRDRHAGAGRGHGLILR